MRCRRCRRELPLNSIFCNWCGAKQIKEENEISVPKPRLLKSGAFSGQVMVGGKRVTVTEDTEVKYYAKARSVKAGLIEASKKPVRHTLGEVVDGYIGKNENVLSPSTIRGYSYIRKGRFKNYMDSYVDSIDWQRMVNEEAALLSEKTVKNAWALVAASLSAFSYSVPDINLPSVPRKDLSWLNYQQIQTLLSGVRGSRLELPVILALHSLRLSELLALTFDDVYDNTIHVRRAAVFDKDNCLVIKDKTKTSGSARDIPILIPRLSDILPDSGVLVDWHPNALCKAINSLCAKLEIPKVGVHGLRRSFASLGYHLKWSERSIMAIGGWSNFVTVHNIYVKLAQNDVNEDVERMKNYYEFTNEG